VALIAGEDVCWRDDAPCWYAEDVIYEGTPGDWYDEYEIEIPGELSPHEVWQVSIAEIMSEVMEEGQPEKVPCVYAPLDKYTLEVTWSGAYYSWWLGWGRVRPLLPAGRRKSAGLNSLVGRETLLSLRQRWSSSPAAWASDSLRCPDRG
jgi:hypothetical protein